MCVCVTFKWHRWGNRYSWRYTRDWVLLAYHNCSAHQDQEQWWNLVLTCGSAVGFSVYMYVCVCVNFRRHKMRQAAAVFCCFLVFIVMQWGLVCVWERERVSDDTRWGISDVVFQWSIVVRWELLCVYVHVCCMCVCHCVCVRERAQEKASPVTWCFSIYLSIITEWGLMHVFVCVPLSDHTRWGSSVVAGGDPVHSGPRQQQCRGGS